MQLFQLDLLAAVWEMFLRTKDEVRGMAVLGAEWRRRNPDLALDYRRNPELLARFHEVSEWSYSCVRTELDGFWLHQRRLRQARLRLQCRLSALISKK